MNTHKNPQRKTSSIPCNLCNNTDVAVIGTKNRDNKPLVTVICTRCGLVWSDPLPHSSRSYYKDAYRLAYKGTYSPKPRHIYRAGKTALSRLKKMEAFLKEPESILDVGSGGGEFAYLLQILGNNVTGLEPNLGYADYSVHEYGLNIHIGFIQDLDLASDFFDIITAWHVLEHTENPSAVLAKLYGFLKPQGVFIVEVPNIESVRQSSGSRFHDAHLFNFNRNTLMKLAEKAGFIEERCYIAPGGGNFTILFRKPEGVNRHEFSGELSIPGNFERIVGILQSHHAMKHYSRAFPYLKFYRRISRVIREKYFTRNFTGGKNLLDRLYKKALWCHL